MKKYQKKQEEAEEEEETNKNLKRRIYVFKMEKRKANQKNN